MARKRIYEIAREQGIQSKELLERLEAAGIEGKVSASSIEEHVALAALVERGDETGEHDEPESPAPASVSRGVPQRLRRLRLRRLRRKLDGELSELGGWLLEMRSSGSRRDDLLEARLARARQREAELRELEDELGAREGGGTCSRCGLHSKRGRFCLACGHRLEGPESRRAPIGQMSLPVAALAVVVFAAAWLLGGVRGGRESTARQVVTRVAPAPRKPPPVTYRYLVAAARGHRIGIYSSPGETWRDRWLSNPNLDGAPLVFLVKRDAGSWLQVYLPSRPNGSVGWIRARDVSLSGHNYRVLIQLGRHRLTAWNDTRVIARVPVGVGRAVTPTPSGLYYITELLKQPDPTGVYGPWAFGLSAHSDVLHEFAGRDGILGLHGTDFPSGIGTDVSHGCIRMSNADITHLAHTLPLGTPVRISRA